MYQTLKALDKYNEDEEKLWKVQYTGVMRRE